MNNLTDALSACYLASMYTLFVKTDGQFYEEAIAQELCFLFDFIANKKIQGEWIIEHGSDIVLTGGKTTTLKKMVLRGIK